MIIHIHVARTAGTSIRQIFQNNFQNVAHGFHREMCYPSFYKKVYDVVCGHVPFGTHCYFPNVDNYNYVVFLREPISRWISYFNKTMQFNKSGKMRDKWICNVMWRKRSGQNVASFLNLCIKKGMHSNTMVRQVAGVEDWKNIKQEKTKYAYLWSPRRVMQSDEEMEKMLEIAKHNLLKEIDFVGFQENGDRDIRKMCDRFNMRSSEIPRTNVATPKNAVSKLKINWEAQKLKNLLYELNKFDIKLYEFAKNSFY